MRERSKIFRKLGQVNHGLKEAEKELQGMRKDPDYIKCRKAWDAGIGWGLYGKNSEDVKEWTEAIDNQRALIDSYKQDKQLLESLL